MWHNDHDHQLKAEGMEKTVDGRNPLDAWEGRLGLRRIPAFFSVFGAALFRPHVAYAPNGKSAKIGAALLFWTIAAALSFLLSALIQSVFPSPFNMAADPIGLLERAVLLLIGMICSTFGVVALACYQHLFAALLGAGRNGLGVSLRAFLYMNGALILLAWTPCVGLLLYPFWGFYLTVAGLQAAHETSAFRAFLAAALAWGLLLALAAFAAFVFALGLIQLLAPSAPPIMV